MAKIQGVGAVILYANDPAALARWYEERLGIETEFSEVENCFYGKVGDGPEESTVLFGILPAKDPLPAGPRAAMVNYRVDDFEGFAAALESRGIAVERLPDQTYGRFGHARDPEGNPIEIWEPPPKEAEGE